jgi:Fur family ferric uptake transcriptional regulator
MPYVTASEVLASLSARRQRLTRPRRAVTEALFAAGRPMTVHELHTLLTGVDLVTVYRTLGWLVKLGVAREVALVPGAERFEPVNGHAHHLHCDHCGRITTTPACGMDLSVLARILHEHGFEVADHAITFNGRCAECRGAGR